MIRILIQKIFRAKIPKELHIHNKNINCSYFFILCVFIGCFVAIHVGRNVFSEIRFFDTLLSLDVDWSGMVVFDTSTADHNLEQVHLCDDSSASIDFSCLAKTEAIVKESARSTFFSTHAHQAHFFAEGRFTTVVEDVSITFRFSEEQPILKVGGGTESSDEYISSDDLHTNVVNSDLSFQPGTKITLKLSDVIRAASRGDESHVVDGGQLGLDLKKTGGEIGAQANCGESNRCFLQFFWITNNAERSEMVVSEGHLKVRTYHGIRLTCLEGKASIRGSWRPDLVFATVGTLLIWISALKRLLNWFILHCLGQLSTIYRNAAHDELSIREYGVNCSLQMIAFATIYADLTAFMQDEDGISLSCVNERLRKILENDADTMTSEEVDHFSGFVHLYATQRFGKINKGDTNGIGTSSGPLKRTASSIRSHIDIGQFIEACSSMHGVVFHDIVRLFDRERRLGFFERLFFPTELKRVVYDKYDEKYGSVFASMASEVSAMKRMESHKGNVHKAHSLISEWMDKFGDLDQRLGDLEASRNMIKASMQPKLCEHQGRHDIDGNWLAREEAMTTQDIEAPKKNQNCDISTVQEASGSPLGITTSSIGLKLEAEPAVIETTLVDRVARLELIIKHSKDLGAIASDAFKPDVDVVSWPRLDKIVDDLKKSIRVLEEQCAGLSHKLDALHPSVCAGQEIQKIVEKLKVTAESAPASDWVLGEGTLIRARTQSETFEFSC